MAEFTFNLRCPLRGRLVIRSCLEVTCLPAYAVIVAESRCGFSQHHCSPSHSRTVGNKEHVCLSAATLFCGCVKGFCFSFHTSSLKNKIGQVSQGELEKQNNRSSQAHISGSGTGQGTSCYRQLSYITHEGNMLNLCRNEHLHSCSWSRTGYIQLHMN